MASSTQTATSLLHADQRQLRVTVFAGFLVAAGLINALIVSLLLCITPKSHVPSLARLLVRAFIYVAVVTLSGVVGSWLYWRRFTIPSRSDAPFCFSLFTITNSTGWVWVPSIVLLWRQDSPVIVLMAAVSTAILTAGLRKTIPSDSPILPSAKREIFAESLQTPPREATAYVIAVCIYLAGYALHDRSDLAAGALLSFCTFLAAWKLTLVPEVKQKNTQAIRRLAPIALSAVLVTFLVLLVGVSQNQTTAPAQNHASSRADANPKSKHSVQSSKISGYESVILWPATEKKKMIAPLPRTSQLSAEATKSVIIPFHGQYWYFQVPDKGPGPKAHIAHGDPLAVNIHSSDFFPLTMAAHQDLDNSIHLSCCREIQVIIQNSDNKPGAIALAVLLTDSTSPGKPTIYLGQQPILSTQPGHFSIKHSPIAEMLRFSVPSSTKTDRFDGITVVFLPDVEHSQIGPKIAIQQFELLPGN